MRPFSRAQRMSSAFSKRGSVTSLECFTENSLEAPVIFNSYRKTMRALVSMTPASIASLR